VRGREQAVEGEVAVAEDVTLAHAPALVGEHVAPRDILHPGDVEAAGIAGTQHMGGIVQDIAAGDTERDPLERFQPRLAADQRSHLAAALEQEACQMRPDEAGRAGKERARQFSGTSVTARPPSADRLG
jgi:hypothetical protein